MEANGFSSFQNYISEVEESVYKDLDSYEKILNGVAHLTNNYLFLVDFYKGSVLYLSSIPLILCNMSPEEIRLSAGKLNTQFVTPHEYEMINNIIKSWFSFLMDHPIEERKAYSVQFDYHLNKRLLNVSMIPIFLSKEGKPWLIICNVRIPTSSKEGNAKISKNNSTQYWHYSRNGKWIAEKQILLDEIEQKIISLSIQGKKEKEICEVIFRSKDGLKSIKRRIFRKMKVRNITEAVSYAISHGMIQLTW